MGSSCSLSRWWFVSPEGNAFLSFGINHVDAGDLLRAHNAGFWERAFGCTKASAPDQWEAKFGEKVKKDLAAFGFNTLGFHGYLSAYGGPGFSPYIRRFEFGNLAYCRAPADSDFIDVLNQPSTKKEKPIPC